MLRIVAFVLERVHESFTSVSESGPYKRSEPLLFFGLSCAWRQCVQQNDGRVNLRSRAEALRGDLEGL
jgi:hypothetical protein